MTARVGGHMPSLRIRRRKGIVGEEGGKRGEKGEKGGGNLPLSHRYFAPAPLSIHLLKTWELKVSTKVVYDH